MESYLKANFFSSQNDQKCPHIEKLGVCLEPLGCELSHGTNSSAGLSLNSAEFDPSKVDHHGQDVYQEMMEQDADEGIVFMDKFKDCKCCSGYVNNCNGVACQGLGFCTCVAILMHEQ